MVSTYNVPILPIRVDMLDVFVNDKFATLVFMVPELKMLDEFMVDTFATLVFMVPELKILDVFMVDTFAIGRDNMPGICTVSVDVPNTI